MDFSASDKYIDDNASDFVSDLASLIKIPSKKGAPKDGCPFGQAPAEALAQMTAIAESAGFNVKNHENYILECNFNDKETALGIIAHLDVVPEGSGWSSDPFTLTEKDGVLFGRGVMDDKGPALAAFYALKALKAQGASLSKNVLLLFGADEESGMEDLEYYRNKFSLPPMMLSPDGAFPVINVEKGLCQINFEKKYASDGGIKSVKAGSVVNAVPDHAEAFIEGITKNEVEVALDGLNAEVISEQGGVRIIVTGCSAHGSMPERGDNALTALLLLIGKLSLPDSELLQTVNALSSLFPYGEGDGEHMGLKMSDKESGPLTAVLSVFDAENGNLHGGIDIRFPATIKLAKVKEIVEAHLLPLGLSLSCHEMEGHLVPSDSDFIKTLLSCYEDVTGLPGKCLSEGGASYLHTVGGGVAFGAEMPGEETNMHGADEHVKLSSLLDTAKIYARAIYKLCK